MLPTDPRFLALVQEPDLLNYTYHYLRKREEDQYQRWGRLLGVIWSRQDVEAMLNSDKSASAPERVFTPLSLAINPDLRDGLKDMFRVHKGAFVGGGEYHPESQEEIVEMGDMDRDEFLRFASAAGQGVTQASKRAAVTIREGQSDNAQMHRIQEQIAHSKRR